MKNINIANKTDVIAALQILISPSQIINKKKKAEIVTD